MVAVILGSVLWSAFPDITLRRASATALVALVCFAIAASGLPLSRIHGALVAVLGVAVAGALLVTALRPDFAVTPIGIRGFYQHKNVLGMVAFIATVVVACRLCALGPGRLVARLAHAAVLAGGLILLVLSQSKTSLAIAAGLVAAIPLFVAMRRLRGGRAGLWLLVLALFGLAGATLVAGLPSRSLMTLVASDVDLTFTGRDEIWNFVLSEVAQRPWTGFGYGAYWDVTPEADPVTRAPPDGWLRQARVGIINQAHNGYLDVAVQLGLPGLALAVGLLLWSFWRALALFMRPETPSGERWAALTIVLLFAGITIHNLSETSLWARGQILANLTLLLMFLAAAAPGAAAARPDRPGRWGRG
ncbi:MAG: O-antigen ligase family protein [Methylobacterium frigidaeris]